MKNSISNIVVIIKPMFLSSEKIEISTSIIHNLIIPNRYNIII